jgi:MFS family permease
VTQAKGKLYLVPAPLDFGCDVQAPLQDVLPLGTLQTAAGITHWICENAKSARAYLKRIDAVAPLAAPLQAQAIQELPREVHKKGDHAGQFDARPLLAAALEGRDIGLLSEAGMPAVADPGSSVARAAHDLGIEVVPLTGPVSLLLALAASGLNGQNFAFVGYLPQDAGGAPDAHSRARGARAQVGPDPVVHRNALPQHRAAAGAGADLAAQHAPCRGPGTDAVQRPGAQRNREGLARQAAGRHGRTPARRVRDRPLKMPAVTASTRWASRAQFFSAGFIFATWGVHVPTVKAHYGIDEAQLGLAMLAAGAGAMIGLTSAGRWIGRHGPRRVAGLCGCIYALLLAGLIAMPGYAALLGLLAAFGLVTSVFDVSINTEAAQLELHGGTPLMSGMHGMFSLGGMAGAASGSAALAAGLGAQAHLLIVSAAMVVLVAVASTRMLPRPATSGASEADHGFLLPRGTLAVLGALAALGLIAEGAIYDWSVLYMQQEIGSPQQQAALAYASFSPILFSAKVPRAPNVFASRSARRSRAGACSRPVLRP